jgi:hypothetical protein
LPSRDDGVVVAKLLLAAGTQVSHSRNTGHDSYRGRFSAAPFVPSLWWWWWWMEGCLIATNSSSATAAPSVAAAAPPALKAPPSPVERSWRRHGLANDYWHKKKDRYESPFGYNRSYGSRPRGRCQRQPTRRDRTSGVCIQISHPGRRGALHEGGTRSPRNAAIPWTGTTWW